MKTIIFEHSLSEKEKIFLQNLIGKDLCGISSDMISIQANKPERWYFNDWIELSNWNDKSVLKISYSFSETYSLVDFIVIKFESIQKESKALNASIGFGGDGEFTIQKIEIYGYNYETSALNYCGNLENDKLTENEEYIEVMRSEEVILIYGSNNKRLLIECQSAFSEISVTMNEKYISNKINLGVIKALKLIHIIQ